MPDLMPEMIDSGKSKDIEAAMRKDLRAAAKLLRGKDAFFVVAANVPTADKKKISMFVVSKLEAESKAWQLKLKGKKPQALVSGTCTLATKDGISVAVALDKVKGDRKAALKIAKLAFKTDVKVQVADPQDEGKESESSESSMDEAKAKKELDSISPEIGSIVDEADVDNAEALKILKQFEEMGLSPDQLEAALKETFG
jgi:hypothetical protein